MKLYSTSHPRLSVSFSEAVEKGIAEDGGLFMPVDIPKLPSEFFLTIGTRSFQENSYLVARALIDGEIPDKELKRIIVDAVNFPAPLAVVDDHTAILELFHGPTLAFKDFGARFMARTLAWLSRNEDTERTVLVATSGDTGSAVAHGFLGVPGINVVLLYPSGRVSRIQELQLTTVGNNVTAIEVTGTFDDCQRLVKAAFADPELAALRQLTSANSINIARLIPQSFYYIEGAARLVGPGQPVIFSVPSGNLGNLTAGLFARGMGLPVERFIAATNANAVLGAYLSSGSFTPADAIATISNAMDVGNPSNLARVIALFGGNIEAMRTVLHSPSYSDEQTRETMRSVYERFKYLIDPHGAVGYRALEDFRATTGSATPAIVLETAHPAKFPEAFDPSLRSKIQTPERLSKLLDGVKQSVLLPPEVGVFKEYLMSTGL
jgi:threonine synthase